MPPLPVILALICACAVFLFLATRGRKARGIEQSTEGTASAPHADYLLYLPQQFAIVDVETTGLEPDFHEIIEIAAIKIVDPAQTQHQSFSAFVKPRHPIPREITTITGITDKMVRDADEIESVIQEFLDFVGDARLVAHNARFDLGFLKRAAARIGREVRNPASCTLRMARRAWPERSSYKLKDLAATGGLGTRGMHRSLADCHVTLTLYVALVGLLREAE